jgi:hypothetical protein
MMLKKLEKILIIIMIRCLIELQECTPFLNFLLLNKKNILLNMI